MNRQMTQGTVANNVQVIPATKRRVSAGGQLKKAKDIRVAAYGRVSTDELAQQTSYEGQKSYYTKLINEKEGWTFAGMYADEAISGTNRNHRTEFNQMMQDALDGKIDYIITKSISRFARNTVDTLNCVRQLRQCDPPIGVYFEKENIDTLDASGELLLTILSALAQEESNSISKNISWSIQKRFQEGIAFGNPRSVYGYTDGETNKDWVIVEEQAKVVDDLRERLNEKMDERQQLSQEEQLLSEMKHNYDFFIRCLEALPEINKAGMKLNVNGLDTDGSCLRDFGGKARSKILSDIRRGKRKMSADRVDQAPDFLEFEKGIYFAFIKEGIVDGDVVTYTTNFGVKLTSTGNSRTLMAFIGFRRCNPNKTVEVLMDGWQVNGLCIRYHREKRKEKTAHTLMIRKRKAQERALLEQEA